MLWSIRQAVVPVLVRLEAVTCAGSFICIYLCTTILSVISVQTVNNNIDIKRVLEKRGNKEGQDCNK